MMLSMRSAPCARPGCSRVAVAQRVAPLRTVLPSSSEALSGLRVGQRLDESAIVAPSAGMKWTMMRHGNKVNHMGRPADQRKALLRSLVTELLRHGQIRTTKTKAKAMRKYVDHMIGLAKEGTLHARRQALAFVFDKALVGQVFTLAPDKYKDRTSGFTRIKTEPFLRRGDATEMAVIELV